MTYREDHSIYPVLVALTACLCQELEAAGTPPVCRCELRAGSEVAIDAIGECDDSCGMAWVRLASGVPSSSFPDPDFQATCVTAMAWTVEIGVMRCAPQPDDRGNPPSWEEELDSARLVAADMNTMRRAIQCCLEAQYDGDLDYLITGYTSFGPQGAVVGGLWTVQIAGR